MAFARPHWSADPRRSSEYIALRRQFREACRLVRNPDDSYGAPCSICRRPINNALTHPHPAAFSVDHIRPVRSHPELALSLGNFQPAHWRCNRNTRRRLSAQFTLRMTQQAPAKLDDAARKVTRVGERGERGRSSTGSAPRPARGPSCADSASVSNATNCGALREPADISSAYRRRRRYMLYEELGPKSDQRRGSNPSMPCQRSCFHHGIP